MSRGSISVDSVRTNGQEDPTPARGARPGRSRQTAPIPSPRPGSWLAFTRALAETLAVLDDKQYLILDRKPAGVYVQVAAGDDGGLRIEAVSNHYLQGDERLDRAKIRRLRALGWLAPTYVPDQPRKTKRPRKGSPNFYLDLEGEVDYAAVAGMLVATLREVYKVSRPGRLSYKAFDADDRMILLPTLGIDSQPGSTKRPDPPAQCRPTSPDDLRTAVLVALRERTGKPDLEFDDDGTLSLTRDDDVSVFIRVAEDTPVVDLFSNVLRGAEPSLELLEALNERNNKSRFVMFTLRASEIVAYTGVDAKLFVPEMLTRALGWIADASMATRTELRQLFAGKIAFEGENAPRSDNTPEAVN